VSAVGQLNQPRWPDIEGVDSFTGKKMHSARWDWSYDLTDKKIALLGNGCTAVQILPEITKQAKKITVFQRTPNWVVPRMDAPVSPLQRKILRYVPPVRWYKRTAQMDFRESTYNAITDDKSDMAKLFKDMCLDMMHKQLPNQPEMWEKLTPKYNVGCKRIIISDDYYPALDEPNVELETKKIHSIADRAVKVIGDDGQTVDVESDYDLLICATGFKTLQFMYPIKIYGKGGRALNDIWEGGARAYMGTTVEDLPNFGILYGPNTNLGKPIISTEIQ
jgi:cation diffusion facilitator CzcD-associated flavoprotein CzcO